jgi:hypothetical protein
MVNPKKSENSDRQPTEGERTMPAAERKSTDERTERTAQMHNESANLKPVENALDRVPARLFQFNGSTGNLSYPRRRG